MAEFLKIISVTIIMSTIAHIGGRKSDKYFMMMVGASGAGMLIIQGCTEFSNKILNSSLIQSIKGLFEFIIG